MMSFTVGYVVQEVARLNEPNLDPGSWGTGLYGLGDLSSQDTPNLIELAPAGLQRDSEEQFATGLELVLTGLSLRLDAQQPEPDGRPCP